MLTAAAGYVMPSLLGAGAKPFECVGEVTECRAAVLLAARRDDRTDSGLLQELAAEVASWPDAPSHAETAAMLEPVGRNRDAGPKHPLLAADRRVLGHDRHQVGPGRANR